MHRSTNIKNGEKCSHSHPLHFTPGESYHKGKNSASEINKTQITDRAILAKHLCYVKVLLPTDAQENCFKRSLKIYIKTAPTCFGVITIIRECTIWVC